MKIGDEVYVHGYVDEIRSDVVIIRNDGGYFGTVPSEVNCSEKPNNCEDECEKCKHFREEADTYTKQCEFYFMECHYEPKTEPQADEFTEEEKRCIEGFIEMMKAANAYGINDKDKDEPQTERSE